MPYVVEYPRDDEYPECKIAFFKDDHLVYGLKRKFEDFTSAQQEAIKWHRCFITEHNHYIAKILALKDPALTSN